jgi:ACT domain-containing protein
MTIREAAKALGAEAVQDDFEDAPLQGAYTSDLLSDIMANAKEGGALITIQAHKNTVAVATLVNVSVIFVCNSRPIPDEMIESAREEGIAIYRTRESQYTVSGKLYAMLHRET